MRAIRGIEANFSPPALPLKPNAIAIDSGFHKDGLTPAEFHRVQAWHRLSPF
jgi:hypothetical protein